MPCVSIVVPVYNVEKYLNRCVESLIHQTLKDIEIILVDDGSKDGSGLLCDEWCKKDSRIQVVHKINGGLSSARNAGLKVVSGKYVGFVDSDDDIDLEMYEKMFSAIEEYHVDFVMSDYYRILSNGDEFLKSLEIQGGFYSKDKIIDDIFHSLIMSEDIDYGPLLSVWHCLYRTDFLRENNIYFDEEVRWSEDNIFSAIVGYNANSFYYLKGEGLYHYYQNEGSITTSYRKGAWDVYMTMSRHLHEYFDCKMDYDFSRQLKLHVLYYACNCINQACALEKEKALKEIKEILHSKELCEVFKGFKFPEVSFKLKIQLALIKYKCAAILYYKFRG